MDPECTSQDITTLTHHWHHLGAHIEHVTPGANNTWTILLHLDHQRYLVYIDPFATIHTGQEEPDGTWHELPTPPILTLIPPFHFDTEAF